jgi:protein-S-isoprenylcysteine O-methyltransferase Ste14
MTQQRSKEPSTGIWLFVALVVVAALVLLFLGKTFYDMAGSPSNTFYTKLAELTLQLAVVVIVGALLKVGVDWGMDQHRRYLK